jgi:phage baseplate assembly protein W
MPQIAPSPGTGINKDTGRVLSGWQHVLQSLEVIFSTRFGERVLIRWFGSFVPLLLGETMTQPTVLRFWTAICIAVDLWEPRFKITKITPTGTPEDMRVGKIGFIIDGVYRPRGHLGDLTPDGPRRITIGDDGRFK